MDGEDEASWRCMHGSWCLLMTEMVRSLTALSKRENGGDEDGGVSGVYRGSGSEKQEGGDRRLK